MSRFWLLAIGGGAVSVLLYSLTVTGSLGGLVFAYFAALPLFLVGLSLGLTAGATAGVAATLGILIPGGAMAAVGFFFLTALPAVILVRQALLSRTDAQGVTVWYPAGFLVVTLSVIGAGIYTLTALWLSMQPDGFEGAARSFVNNFMESLPEMGAEDQREILADKIASILPGIFAASWFVMTVINATLAQGLLVRFQKNARPSPDIVSMEFPNWFPVAAAISAVIGISLPGALGFYGTNLAIILIIPFFFMGLAVIHSLCRRKPAGPFMLITFYVMLIIFGWLIVIVAALGLIEQWVGLRRRFT